MNEFTHIPAKPLSHFVQYMWYQDGYKPTGRVERVLPSGSSQIIINLQETRFRHFSSDLEKQFDYDDLVLAGLHTVPVFLDSFTRTSTIGVVLKAGAIPVLFNIPAIAFQNEVVSLHELSSEILSELKDKLLATSRPDKKLLEVELYLCRLLDFGSHLNPVVSYSVSRIRQTHGCIDLSEILDYTGYTSRWFIQLFRDAVGTTPKRFARLCRFQHALDLLRTTETTSFSAIALECGYYDQSHFIHDFKEFGGISPSDYCRDHGENKNHLVI